MRRIEYAIRNFAGAIGIFVVAFYVAVAGNTTMSIMGTVAIIAGVCSFRVYDDESGKRYGPYMIFYGVVLAAVSYFVPEKYYGILKYVGAFTVAFVGFFQWVKIANIFGITKAMRRIEGLAIIAFPALIIVGVVLSVFTQKLSLGKELIISGAVIWAIHNAYALVLMNSDCEPDLSKFKFNARHSTYNFDKNKVLDEDDVCNIVHSVASRFERRGMSLPYGADLRLYVYDEVRGNYVNYNISGTVRRTEIMPDNQKAEVQIVLRNKLQQMQQELIRATKRELSKYKQLPYPSYSVQVEIGYFD